MQNAHKIVLVTVSGEVVGRAQQPGDRQFYYMCNPDEICVQGFHDITGDQI